MQRSSHNFICCCVTNQSGTPGKGYGSLHTASLQILWSYTNREYDTTAMVLLQGSWYTVLVF